MGKILCIAFNGLELYVMGPQAQGRGHWPGAAGDSPLSESELRLSPSELSSASASAEGLFWVYFVVFGGVRRPFRET